MKNNYLTDEILFDALVIYEKDWFENSEFDYSDFNPSDKFKKNMQRRIKSCDNVYYKITLTKTRRIVCVIAAIIAILCSSLSVGAVREALSNFSVKSYATNDKIHPDQKKADEKKCPKYLEKVYELGYVPEGFMLSDESIVGTEGGVGGSATYIYTCEERIIMFEQNVADGYGMSIDNEHSKSYQEEFDGQLYLIYEHFAIGDDSKVEAYSFLWEYDGYLFDVYANLPKEDIINLCKSIKVREN